MVDLVDMANIVDIVDIVKMSIWRMKSMVDMVLWKRSIWTITSIKIHGICGMLQDILDSARIS